MLITIISDTHTKHHHIPKEHLPGGDMIIHYIIETFNNLT